MTCQSNVKGHPDRVLSGIAKSMLPAAIMIFAFQGIAIPFDLKPCMGLQELKTEILREINLARARARMCGGKPAARVHPVTWNTELYEAALGHSMDMARNAMFSHAGSDNSGLTDRILSSGYIPQICGENLALGPRDAAGVVRAWLNSSGHCENIMSPEFREIGACCVKAGGKTYWTLILAAPQGDATGLTQVE